MKTIVLHCGTSKSFLEHSLPPLTFHGTFIAQEFSYKFHLWNVYTSDIRRSSDLKAQIHCSAADPTRIFNMIRVSRWSTDLNSLISFNISVENKLWGTVLWSTHPSKMSDSVIALLATPTSKRGWYQQIITLHEDHSPSFVELLSHLLSILCPFWLTTILLLQWNSVTSFICGTSMSLVGYSLPPLTFRGTCNTIVFSSKFLFWNFMGKPKGTTNTQPMT